MKIFRYILPLILLFLMAGAGHADPQYVKWTAELQPSSLRPGEHGVIVLTAKIDEPWHIYSTTPVPGGPITTKLTLLPGGSLTAEGASLQPQPDVKIDKNFENKQVEYYEKGVAFGIPVTLKAGMSGPASEKIKLRYQLCNAQSCKVPDDFELSLKYQIEAGAPRAEYSTPVAVAPKQPAEYQNYKPGAIGAGSAVSATPAGTGSPVSDEASQQIEREKKKGIFNFILFSFASGLLALLTPCVFPMIPITVSFFSKSKEGEGGKPDVRGALAYCLGIIGTFTLLGLVLTAFFGPLGISNLAKNPWVNLALGALFIVLAINLFGVFEIVVPSWLLDKAQEGKKKGGVLGPLMMGFAFTLTSFTCTVAFVGTLLVTAAQGDWFFPTVGMLAFSTAFSLPFFLLALFPQYLNSLPKSGSWMISVKAFMGFLELAAALKFISNIDLAFSKGIITREVFLAIWAGLLVVAGLYLVGWLRLAVDSSKKFGVARRTIGAVSVLAGFYCLAAINGAPLGQMAAFLPPSPYPNRQEKLASVVWTHDYKAAVARAQAENKPLFINFTGVQCTNCRDMEANVLPLPAIRAELDKCVLLELYTDQESQESKDNAKLMLEKTKVATLPVYVIAKPNGDPVKIYQYANRDPNVFLKFIQEGIALLMLK